MIKSTHIYVDLDIIKRAIETNICKEDVTVLNSPSSSFFYNPWQIKSELQGTVWQQLLDSLPFDKGEARVIVLKPGESYMAHADIDDRWHLNLSGELSFIIDIQNKLMYETVKDGCWYDMDASQLHVAGNYGSVDRLQLVVRQLLNSSIDKDMISVTIVPSKQQHDYRFKFDRIISPWLNINSKKSLISDFNFQGQFVNFRLSKKALRDFEKILTNDFEIKYA